MEKSPHLKTFVLLSLGLMFMGMIISSCAPTTSTPDPIPQATETAVPTITPTVLLDYEDWESSAIEEGLFARDDFCPISFSYQSRSIKALTAAIANNISEISIDEIYNQAFNQYNQLRQNSPIDFQNTITVYIVPDLSIENCTSHDEVVFTSPGSLDSFTLSEDIIGASTGISKQWVKAGLGYIASDEEIDTQMLQNWYQETEDLDILGLFKARFMTDWASQEEIEIVRMTAASLVNYCLENKNLPIESLGDQINNDIRTSWLNSIGVDRTVDYPYDGLYDTFIFSQSEDCSIIVKTDVMDFCLNKIEENPYFDEVRDAEDLIHRAYTGYQAISDYLITNAPSINHLIMPEETFTIEVKNTDQPEALWRGNMITLQQNSRPDFVLGEIVRRYAWYDDLLVNEEGLLLQQGFSEYLGFLLPIYETPIKTIIWEDLNGLEGIPGVSYYYGLDEEQLTAAKAWYLQQGGSLDSQEVIDPRLFTDAVAFATMDRGAYGGVLGIPIELKFQRYYDVSEMTGVDLTDAQAASYVAWLCDTYTIDTVMAKYVNNAEDTALEENDFPTLKQEWLDYLSEKGEGVPIPDASD